MSQRADQARHPITRLPRGIRGAGSIVVFGGGFDPIHRWHTAVAAAARRRASSGSGAWVLFVPAARSPLKADGPVAVDGDRVEMIRRATRRMARVGVWTDEIDRADSERAPSYSIDTLRRLRDRLPRSTVLWMLIGADQAVNFHRWREHREVMRLARPLVALRPPFGSISTYARAMERTGAWTESELVEWGAAVVPCSVRAVSSTRARRAAARGDRESLNTIVVPAVASWIVQRGLYRDRTSDSRRVGSPRKPI